MRTPFLPPLFRIRPGWMAAALLALPSACGRSAGAPLPPEFEAARAWTNLERLVALGPRYSGSRGNAAAQRLLADELTALGLRPRRQEFRAPTPMGPLPFVNIYADIPGDPASGGAPPPTIVLLSHFDTKRMPFAFVGANDGGSSTAVLLELARCLARDPDRRRVTYRILFVDGEEAIRPAWEGTDNTYGSRHHVEELTRTGAIEEVGACVVLDMVGDRDLGLVHELASTPELLALFQDAARGIGLGRHVGRGYRELRDDHLPFLRAGVPSVDLIDFDYGPDHRFWHTEGDVLANCAPESLLAIGRIVLAGLPALEEWVLARRATGLGQGPTQPGPSGGR